MDSLFGDLDVASAADDPFKIPAGVYPTIVTEANVADTADGLKKGLTLKRTIVEGLKAGRVLSTWHFIPKRLNAEEYGNLSDEGRARYQEVLSYLKKEMLALGIPDSRINSIKPEDLIGLPSVLTVKHKADSNYPTIYSRAARPGEVNIPHGGITALVSKEEEDNPFN